MYITDRVIGLDVAKKIIHLSIVAILTASPCAFRVNTMMKNE